MWSHFRSHARSHRRELTREFGEKFTLSTGPILPFDHYLGDATGCKSSVPGCTRRVPNRSRLGGGSGLAVYPGR